MLFLGIPDMIKKLKQKFFKRVFTGMSKTLTRPLPQYAISPSLEKGGLESIQTSKNHQLALAWTGK